MNRFSSKRFQRFSRLLGETSGHRRWSCPTKAAHRKHPARLPRRKHQYHRLTHQPAIARYTRTHISDNLSFTRLHFQDGYALLQLPLHVCATRLTSRQPTLKQLAVRRQPRCRAPARQILASIETDTRLRAVRRVLLCDLRQEPR